MARAGSLKQAVKRGFEIHLLLLGTLGQVAQVIEEQDVEVVRLAPRWCGRFCLGGHRPPFHRYAGHPARCFWESAQLEWSALLKTATGAFIH